MRTKILIGTAIIFLMLPFVEGKDIGCTMFPGSSINNVYIDCVNDDAGQCDEYVGGNYDMKCKFTVTGSVTGATIYYQDNSEGSWATIPTSDTDIDCSGLGCYQKNAVTNTWYSKNIDAEGISTQNIRCKVVCGSIVKYSATEESEVVSSDNSVPSLEMQFPNDGFVQDVKDGNVIDVNFTVSDESGVDVVQWSNDSGSTWVTRPDLNNFTLGLNLGWNNISLRANDTVGNGFNYTSAVVYYLYCGQGGYNGSGDWNVSGNVVCADQSFTMQGNLTIESTGNLTLDNVTLIMNNSAGNGTSNILNELEGKLKIENSNISTTSNFYKISNKEGSSFFMTSSGISGSGYETLTGNNSIIFENVDGDCDIINSVISDSDILVIYRNASNCMIDNSTLRNGTDYGILVEWSDPSLNIKVNNTVFENAKIWVLAEPNLNVYNSLLNHSGYYTNGALGVMSGLIKNSIIIDSINHTAVKNLDGVLIRNGSVITVSNNSKNIEINDSSFSTYFANNITTRNTDITLYRNMTDFHILNGTITMGFSDGANYYVNEGVVENSSSNAFSFFDDYFSEANFTLIDVEIINSSAEDFEISTFGHNVNLLLINVSGDADVNYNDYGGEYSITRKWYLDVFVQDKHGNPISGANVTGFNASYSEIFSELTNTSGWITRQNVTQYWENSTTRINATPHNITMTYEEDEQEKRITMNENKIITFTTNPKKKSELLTLMMMAITGIILVTRK
ncbi:hypothetical protein D6777_04750 [Candidatus Woesearchaeota archaeon]|nr:MAG: hypothetical protein D6777_04750 [Candidatus Woesearchaeota archaeon]